MVDAAATRVVFVHGAGAGGWEWAIWRAVFAAHGLHGTAPDLQPRVPLADTRFEDYAAQVRTAITALPRPRALVGASLGGLLAAACADTADALVLVNPLPPAPWAADLPPRDWPRVAPWWREARMASTRRALDDADAASALVAFRGWRDESGAVLRAAQAGIAIERPSCPALCIAGTCDTDVPPALTRALALVWSATLSERGGVGHVEPLLGRAAPAIALEAAGWLRMQLSGR